MSGGIIGSVCRQGFAGVSGSGLAGSYAFSYDARGQVTGETTAVNSSQYTSGTSYLPGGQVNDTVYPDGETVTPNYNAEAFVVGLQTQQGGTTTVLASNISYGDDSAGGPTTYGAAGQVVGMTLGNGVYTTSYSYDDDARLTDMQFTRTSDHTLFFESGRAYDPVGNVATEWTRVPQGTDTQAFCYDAQNRLTWAGSAGTPPSGCTSPDTPSSTLPGGGYAQVYSYDTLDRLTSGDLGNYTYGGGSGHLHAVTSIGTAYTATYDLAGNMVCRAPTSATLCGGQNTTGAQLRYDAEERLAAWQNAPTNPTTTASELYDGAGERVAQAVTSGGTTTTTAYLGGTEEVATSGASTTTTTYYAVVGRLVALAVNGTFSYLADDGLGSVNVAFDANGNPTAATLYRPYGGVRYSSGAMPGSFGFTGQRNDTAVTGLDFDHARYYDPSGGVFTTVDSVHAGQNPYGYVGGDPETRVDPSGHKQCPDTGCSGCPGVLAIFCSAGQIVAQGITQIATGVAVQAVQTSRLIGILASVLSETILPLEIALYFHDPRTREVMDTLLASPLGTQFVKFFLQAGSTAVDGDLYITWGAGSGAYTSGTGQITLGVGLLDYGNTKTEGLVNAANALVHEGVESYYALAWGMRTQASRHMDYVAQIYADTVLDQLDFAYGLHITHDAANKESFAAWDVDPNHGGLASYGNEPKEQDDPASIVVGILTANPGYWIDPMGIQLAMLSPNTDNVVWHV